MFILRFLQIFMLRLIRVYELLLIARALLSWFPMLQDNRIVMFIYSITEPVLAPVRAALRKIPALYNIPLDFSILVVFLILDILRMMFISI